MAYGLVAGSGSGSGSGSDSGSGSVMTTDGPTIVPGTVDCLRESSDFSSSMTSSVCSFWTGSRPFKTSFVSGISLNQLLTFTDQLDEIIRCVIQ